MKSFFLLLLSFLELQASQVKVAMLGDSITFGSGATPIQANRYATKLGKFLGDDYLVKTFAASSLCLLQKADRPFLKTTHFTEALSFKPDIAVITLGTNDTCQNDKRKNWEHQNDLTSNAISLINKLRKGNPRMIIHLCSPTPMFPNQKGLKQGRTIDLKTRAKRLPTIQQAYKKAAATDEKIHFHDLTRAISSGHTTDGVHPNNEGHEQLAKHYLDLLSREIGRRAKFSKRSRKTSSWNGFELHDLKLPKSGANARLVVPHTAAKGQPWIWRARFWGHQPALDLALLDRGYHLAFVDVGNLYGNEIAMARGEELYEVLTSQFQLGAKPILEGMSRGGLFIFNFAAKHPDKVTAIYGDNPVCNFQSWPGGMNGKLSKADYARCLRAYGITAAEAKTHSQITHPDFAKKLQGIPVALVIGTADTVVPPAENAKPLAANLSKMKSPVKIWHKPGLGHHPHGLSPVEPLLRFLLESQK
jgi:lysophospholipase L1-like esterase/pimeloyl-ACP methyl ester carboxylesterase|tara:strand:+ start:8000 stop:9424 length:1425 start_codon:yes stop_codon:yes gene_type:complete